MRDETTGDDATRSARTSQAIKGSALGALVAGGVLLYFGFAWAVDAPGSVSKEAAETWFAVDRVFQWCLRILAADFLLVAALAAAGQRVAALLAMIAEGAFTLTMAAMAVDTFLETRADGQIDITTVLLIIMAFVGISAARRSWRLYAGAIASSAPETGS